jgi:hypothetical protein
MGVIGLAVSKLTLFGDKACCRSRIWMVGVCLTNLSSAIRNLQKTGIIQREIQT